MGFVMQLFTIRISTLLHHTDPTLTIRNISRALAEVTDYQGLGIQLGLPLHELNTIEANHQRVERRKMEVLALWLQGPDPEWKDLKQISMEQLLDLLTLFGIESTTFLAHNPYGISMETTS